MVSTSVDVPRRTTESVMEWK